MRRLKSEPVTKAAVTEINEAVILALYSTRADGISVIQCNRITCATLALVGHVTYGAQSRGSHRQTRNSDVRTPDCTTVQYMAHCVSHSSVALFGCI